MRAIFSLLPLMFVIGSSNATMSAADVLSCKLEGEEGFIQRFLNPSAVKFLRNSTIVAEGDHKTHRLGFANYPWGGIPKTWRGAHVVDFELTKDGDGELNYVWFSFIDIQANGFVVLRTMQNKTAVSLYFVDPTDGDRWLSLVYFQVINLDTVFSDLSCLLDNGALKE